MDQVYCVEKQIDEDSWVAGKERFHKVLYEDFCNDVYKELDFIEKFLRTKGCQIATRYDVRERFKFSKYRRIPEEDYNKITVSVRELRPNKSNSDK